MGGGDLNSKKSWHPNTMKNQERVWKAEQAVAEEKKRMLELQREHAQERDRAELNDIISKHNTSASDNRLAWMYDKPDKKVDQEAYLLGKTLDKNPEPSENVEQDPIPAVSRRVVGSSMLTAAGDAQVDMSRKMREDPLLLIKERERAARAALLNNPLQRRKLAELLRKEQEQRKETKVKKKSKKEDKDLDVLLASKLSALGARKGIDIAALLDSDDSSSESEDEKAKKKKKKKQKKEKSKKKKVQTRCSDSDSDKVVHKHKETHYEDHKRNTKTSETDKYYNKYSRKRKSSEDRERSESPVMKKHHKNEYIGSRQSDRDSSNRSKQYSSSHSTYISNRYNDVKEEPRKYSSQRKSPESVRRGIDQRGGKRRTVISDEEKAAKLAEMASAGIEREIQRGSRVAEQRAADVAAERRPPAHSSSRSDARALPDSLESRLHSTRHYIQRDKRQMNESFARR